MPANPLFFISLTALIIATYTDLKQRIVPDKLSYAMIAGGLALQLAVAIAQNTIETFIIAAAATIATFLGAYLLWKTGVWAGGDVKLFTGLAALNPTNHGAIRDILGINLPLFDSITLPVYPFTLFIFSVFSMLPLAILMTISAIAKKTTLQKKLFTGIKSSALQLVFSAMLISAAMFFSAHYNTGPIIPGIAIIAIAFLGKRVLWAAATIGFAAGIIIGGAVPAENFAQTAIALFLAYLLVKIYLISKSDIFIEKIKAQDLREGMICAQTIAKQDGKTIILPPVTMKTIINHVQNNNVRGLMELMKQSGKIICGPANAGGLTEKQAKELKMAAKKGEIGEEMLVKKSVAFVPAVLCAYIITQTIGDILWNTVF